MINKTIFTIGHSTRSSQEFIDLLKIYDIEVLVDVRQYPGSRYCPQFSQQQLRADLLSSSIDYLHLVDLGGRRKVDKNSQLNNAWRSPQFRGYADYMQTKNFAKALSELIKVSHQRLTAIMCAELLVWRCHRSMIADALIARDFLVIDIFDIKTSYFHQITPFAQVDNKKITYPLEKGEQESRSDHD